MNKLMADNAKYLVHMRQRIHRDNRLALCFGAGVSSDFKIPTWKCLVKRIADHQRVKGRDFLKSFDSLATQSQFLYHNFVQSYRSSNSADEVASVKKINTEWLRIVHECLYSDVVSDDKSLKEHPYLWSLLPLIKESSMTINYNFDDTIERMLYLHNSNDKPSGDDKGFEVTWHPTLQFRRSKGAIYHPNGFLPLERIEGFSEQLIFVEEEFADQLIDVSHGHYGALLNHFSKNTVVFIGLSLTDSNLKHLLRVSAKLNPGNFHYHIHWCDSSKPSESEQDAIRKVNFSIYNLVTLFMTNAEIAELASLLTVDAESFNSKCDDIEEGVCTNFRYYVSGPVGSGKSTSLEHIRSISTYDEWVDRRNPLLGKPHVELTKNERREVDDWINNQFRKKNRRIATDLPGISIIDRSPLDPLYFVSEPESEAARAGKLLHAMAPQEGSVTSIADGHLILLRCDSRVLRERLAVREKKYDEVQLLQHSAVIDQSWANLPVTVIDTTNLPIYQVVKRILEIILFGPYQPINFHHICRSKAGFE